LYALLLLVSLTLFDSLFFRWTIKLDFLICAVGTAASGVVGKPAPTRRSSFTSLVKKVVAFFFVNFSQIVPIVHAEMLLQLGYYFLKRNFTFSSSLEKFSQILISADLNDVLNKLT